MRSLISQKICIILTRFRRVCLPSNRLVMAVSFKQSTNSSSLNNGNKVDDRSQEVGVEICSTANRLVSSCHVNEFGNLHKWRITSIISNTGFSELDDNCTGRPSI